MITIVTRIPTMEKTEYSCSPEKAVVAAYEQQVKKNWNSWEYDLSQAKVGRSGKTVYCGTGNVYFSAMLEVCK